MGLKLLILCGFLVLALVHSRSHHNDLHGVDEPRSSQEETSHEEDDDDLLARIEDLDSMIQLVRNARSIPDVPEEEDDDIVGEKEMVQVMDSIDLTNAENVEIVADLMKTLSGEAQLEFLMDKFMMKDSEVREEIMSREEPLVAKSKRSVSGSSFFSRGGHAHGNNITSQQPRSRYTDCF